MFQLQSANLIILNEIQKLDNYADEASSTVDDIFDEISKPVEKHRDDVMEDVKKKKFDKREVLEGQLQMIKVRKL